MSETIERAKVFISYKKQQDAAGNLKHGVPHALAARLSARYDVFIDVNSLEVGRKWADEIYRNIHQSDVLIVVLERNTAESDWVQREVDVARGANVSILPLRVGPEAETEGAVEKLALYDIQHFMAFSIDDAVEFNRLLRDIERLAKMTRNRQRDWYNAVNQLRRMRPARSRVSDTVFRLRDSPSPVRVHLATGDMTQYRDVDVLVNSENDYMQMARVFDAATLSASLRMAGSYITRGRVREDTVQAQLDYQIQHSADYCGRPIVVGQVVPTFAGHPESRLVARNRVRYIFHVATVRIDAFSAQESLAWIESDAGIRQAVINTLDMAREIDARGGQVLVEPASESDRPWDHPTVPPLPDPYRPIERIVLPLFGTGEGGRSVPEVVPPMLHGIDAYFREHLEGEAPNLRHVHLSVFTETYVDVVREIMRTVFDDA